MEMTGEVITLEAQAQHLSSNLKQLLTIKKLSVNQLASLLNIPPMTIRRIIQGETTDPRISTVKMIADFFKVEIDQLVCNDGLKDIHKNLTKPKIVPLLEWGCVIDFTKEPSKFDLSKWNNWQTIPLPKKEDISDDAFALASLPCHYPMFPLNTILVIDPNVILRHDDLVLLLIRQNNELALKIIKIEPPQYLLCSLNIETKPIVYERESHKILGINVLSIYNRK